MTPILYVDFSVGPYRERVMFAHDHERDGFLALVERLGYRDIKI